MSTNQLAQVVAKATDKHVSAKVFLSLISHILSKRQVSDAEIASSMIEICQPSNIDTQIQLVLQWAIEDEINTAQFFRSLVLVPYSIQTHYLRSVPRQKLPSPKQQVISTELLNYVQKVTEKLGTEVSSKELSTYLTTLVLVIHQTFCIASIPPHGEMAVQLRDLGHKLLTLASKFNLDRIEALIHQVLSQSTHRVASNAPPTAAGTSAPTKASHKGVLFSPLLPASQVHYNHNRMSHFHDSLMRTRPNQNPQIYLQCFTNQFIDPKNQKDNALIAAEMIRNWFNMISILSINSEQRSVLFNYKNFIVSQLPRVLALLQVDSLEQIIMKVLGEFAEEPYASALSATTIGKSQQYDLRQAFVKGCILAKVLSIHSYQKIFPFEKNQSLVSELGQANTDIHIDSRFNETLTSVNPEFTSLEESGLFEFLDSAVAPLEYLSSKQEAFSTKVIKVMETLIVERDNVRLYRLMMALLNKKAILSTVAYFATPDALVKKLIDYIDDGTFNFDDEENFQDHYSYVGVIVVAVIGMCEFFHLEIKNYAIKGSFMMDYLNNFYYRLCPDMSNEAAGTPDVEDQTIIANFDQLSDNWIQALFDDANDGLSDELLKSISIKQIYRLIPILYRQAIQAGHTGQLPMAVLNNGLEYLSQMFLVPATVCIINWLIDRISFDGTNDSLYIDVLNVIFQSNLQEGESSKLLLRLVITVTGSNVLQTLRMMKNWEQSSKIKGLISILTQNVDLSYIDSDRTTNSDKSLEINPPQVIRNVMLISVSKSYNNDVLPCGVASVSAFFLHNQREIVNLIVDEVSSYLASNNDNSKLLVLAASYYFVLHSVKSIADKQYWIDTLSSSPPTKREILGETLTISSKREFSLEMDRHYSSIFNEKKSDSMFDDMMEDDDGLFNDEKSRISTSTGLSNLQTIAYRKYSFLQALQEKRIQTQASSPSAKPLSFLVDRVLGDIADFEWL